MNFTKIITGVIAGAIFTGISLAVAFYLFQMNTKASGPLGPASNFAFLGIIFGVVYGSIIGGLAGTVIVGLQLNLFKATFFGLIFNLILGLGLSLMLGADWNEKLIYDFLIPMLVGIANAVIVSSLSKNTFS